MFFVTTLHLFYVELLMKSTTYSAHIRLNARQKIPFSESPFSQSWVYSFIANLICRVDLETK